MCYPDSLASRLSGIVAAMMTPSYDLDTVGRQIPILGTHIPMNNCSQARQSHVTRAAADEYLAS